jgi:predicted acyl esterase
VNLASHLIQRLLKLPPATTRDLLVQRDLRVLMPDGVELLADRWATAYRFKAGHRVRVQVSSGAFPRYARNPGTGEPIATATTLKVAEQAVYHDPAHPSAVILPILQTAPVAR